MQADKYSYQLVTSDLQGQFKDIQEIKSLNEELIIVLKSHQTAIKFVDILNKNAAVEAIVQDNQVILVGEDVTKFERFSSKINEMPTPSNHEMNQHVLGCN